MAELFLGVDVGALTTKALVIDGSGRALGFKVIRTGANSREASLKAHDLLFSELGLSRDDVAYTVATGYGRAVVPYANESITEITCHARGAYHLIPTVRTVIDVGGQDSKVIRVGEGGRVLNFVMNEKCAAGTGRFLEVMAQALEVALEDMGRLSLQSRSRVSISSTCTVFAESEVVGLIAKGVAKEDIIAGIHEAMASRIYSMAMNVGVEDDVVMTGGVAKNQGFIKALEAKLGRRVLIPEEPQVVGALGAALIARERWRTQRR
ncbi:MAG: 2-hydroxyglutaryl-CoA dehydratase [Thermoprotei archaeon]|nr:MAG: 2-hydroxyglutaryl-CoA dehydratase [Thermoprotei archaeon]